MTHPLISWLAAHGKSQREFSEEAGVSQPSLLRLIHGKSELTTVLIRKVSEGTGGDVTEKQLFAAWIDARDAKAFKANAELQVSGS